MRILFLVLLLLLDVLLDLFSFLLHQQLLPQILLPLLMCRVHQPVRLSESLRVRRPKFDQVHLLTHLDPVPVQEVKGRNAKDEGDGRHIEDLVSDAEVLPHALGPPHVESSEAQEATPRDHLAEKTLFLVGDVPFQHFALPLVRKHLVLGRFSLSLLFCHCPLRL